MWWGWGEWWAGFGVLPACGLSDGKAGQAGLVRDNDLPLHGRVGGAVVVEGPNGGKGEAVALSLLKDAA